MTDKLTKTHRRRLQLLADIGSTMARRFTKTLKFKTVGAGLWLSDKGRMHGNS